MVMPSKSKKQQNFMAAVANNPKFAKKAGVPQSVGKDYEKADKMKGMKKYHNARLDVRPMSRRAKVWLSQCANVSLRRQGHEVPTRWPYACWYG
jgi:hypothetical protein